MSSVISEDNFEKCRICNEPTQGEFFRGVQEGWCYKCAYDYQFGTGQKQREEDYVQPVQPVQPKFDWQSMIQECHKEELTSLQKMVDLLESQLSIKRDEIVRHKAKMERFQKM